MFGVPIFNLVFTLALLGIFVTFRQITVSVDGTTYYFDIFSPSFDSLFEFTYYGNCSVVSDDIMVALKAAPSWQISSIFYVLFLIFGILMSCPLIWLANAEVQGNIDVQSFEPGHRYALIVYSSVYLFVYIIILVIGGNASYPYWWGCFDEVDSLLASVDSSASSSLEGAQYPMIANWAIDWATMVLALILTVVFLFVLGKPRPFYDPIAWDPQYELSRGG